MSSFAPGTPLADIQRFEQNWLSGQQPDMSTMVAEQYPPPRAQPFNPFSSIRQRLSSPMQRGIGQIGPYDMGMGGGFNPYQQAPSYDMYLMQQMGGGFNPYQQGFGGGGFNPYQQMGGGFNPYQQMMGGGFNPYQQGLNPSIPGMGGFGQFTAPAPRNPYASIRQDIGPRPMPQQTTYTPSPMPMERPVNEAALDMGALPIRDFMPRVAEPAQPTPAAGMGPPAAQQRKYMEIFSTPARPQQQFQPTGSADMAYRGPAMTPQQLFARAQSNQQLEQQRMGMQQQAMGGVQQQPISQSAINQVYDQAVASGRNVFDYSALNKPGLSSPVFRNTLSPSAPAQPAYQPQQLGAGAAGQDSLLGPKPSVQNASNQAAGGQPARLF